MTARWLVIGHGSVGSALVRRLVRNGVRPSVYDPTPRVPVVGADCLTKIDADAAPFDIAVSCVVPAAAVGALAVVRPLLRNTSLYLEWNTVTPAVKRAVGAAAPCPVVDVALMDTLDDGGMRPMLVISGSALARAVPLLEGLGFSVDLAGAECGDAAFLKLARSLFMKSLEALVVEFEAALASVAGRDVVMASIERNLGERFTAFARMLLETDRIHAARRSRELQEAVAVFGETGRSVRVAEASIDVLGAAADVWRMPGAPDARAGAADFARFLAQQLRTRLGRHAAG